MKKVEIWTDGACSGNPGPGGWGALLRFQDSEKELCGGDVETTNNRMEMMGAIQALDALKESCEVTLWTDSTYVKKGITEWITGWVKRNWKNSAGKPVKNKDLWQILLASEKRHNVTWKWVKGHAGHAENERVDELARRAIPQ